MTPTAESRARLRKLLNEVIPEGGTDNDTQFLDIDLDELLIEAQSIYVAAANGWIMKAGMLQGKIESYGTGQEKYDLTKMKDQFEHALTMSKLYNEMSSTGTDKGSGSVILQVARPGVL